MQKIKRSGIWGTNFNAEIEKSLEHGAKVLMQKKNKKSMEHGAQVLIQKIRRSGIWGTSFNAKKRVRNMGHKF